MMVPIFLYSKSYHFLNIIIIIIVVVIFLLPTYFSLSDKATEPTIFQHSKAFAQDSFS